MKKIIILSVVSVLLLNITYSQDHYSKPRLGFSGGAVFSKYRIKMDNTTASTDMKTDFSVGTLVDVPLGKNIFLQPGINWTRKGGITKESYGSTTYKDILTINYIEIPVNLLYKYKGFFFGTGVSVSSAMEGHVKYQMGDEEETEDVEFGKEDTDDMKQLDWGVNLLASYELPSGFFISLNFNQGLRNLYPVNDDGIKAKFHYFGIRIGYLIKGKN